MSTVVGRTTVPLGYLKSENCTWHQADRRMKFSDNYSSAVYLVISIVVFQTVGRGETGI